MDVYDQIMQFNAQWKKGYLARLGNTMKEKRKNNKIDNDLNHFQSRICESPKEKEFEIKEGARRFREITGQPLTND